ncbi:MAG TPA: DJ-1 family protein [Bacteroidales bacterium]|nr:DJ-1 family protein [Bacteroidales bacterium]
MHAYVFLADGFEDIEAVAAIDILRRAAVEVNTVSITNEHSVTTAHGITMLADTTIDKITITDDDLMLLPGGMPGTTNLAKCKTLCDMLIKHNNAHGKIAAICAAPSILGQLGILKAHTATCYPGFEDQLGCEYDSEQAVVVSDNIITSCGPGQAMAFALLIVGTWVSENTMQKLIEDMQF